MIFIVNKLKKIKYQIPWRLSNINIYNKVFLIFFCDFIKNVNNDVYLNSLKYGKAKNLNFEKSCNRKKTF